MLDLILIVALIVSLVKPDIYLAQKVKDKATDEQKATIIKNIRKIYGISIVTIESLAIFIYFEVVSLILTIICFILIFVIVIPAIKENAKIMKELN